MFRGGPVSFLLTCELTFRSRRCDPVDFAFGCLFRRAGHLCLVVLLDTLGLNCLDCGKEREICDSCGSWVYSRILKAERTGPTAGGSSTGQFEGVFWRPLSLFSI